MRLRPVPVLHILRDVWSMPRDRARFDAYLAKVKSGPEGEVFAPLIAANPMAREHMIALADRLLAEGADAALAEACVQAERRLGASDLDANVSLTPVDDLGGAWSERTLVDFDMRFDSKRPKRDYGFVTAVVYAGESPTIDTVRERVLAAIYRAAHVKRHGHPETVREMMTQEGRALRFAGISPPRHVDVAAARDALAPHLDATLHATRFAAIYGDEAAKRVGHRPLGVPENAAFAVALAEAAREPPPESFV